MAFDLSNLREKENEDFESNCITQAYHGHFDCFSGAAGDMMLAAVVDCHRSPEEFLNEIQKRLEGIEDLKGDFSFKMEKVWRGKGGIAARKVNVHSIYGDTAAPKPKAVDPHDVDNSHNASHNHDHRHNASHNHEHDHSHSSLHSHEHDNSHSTSHSHEHNCLSKSNENSHSQEDGHSHSLDGPIRNLAEITRLINSAPCHLLPSRVKELSIATFSVLAEAEALTHGSTIEHVHFHEVGAIDSIVDTVGTILGLHLLGVDSFSCSRIPIGNGQVFTSHGILPVPAPATLRMMKDMKVCPGPSNCTGELVTPTAMALLKVLVGPSHSGLSPNFDLKRIGIGAGTKDFHHHPNILRLLIGDRFSFPSLSQKSLVPSEPWKYDTLCHLESNIDDMTPETLAYVIEKLLSVEDCLDAWVNPILMKKGRSAHQLHVLCHQTQSVINEMLLLLFRETTSIGIRIYNNIQRAALERSFISIPFSNDDDFPSIADCKVNVKVAKIHNNVISIKPEFEDCKRIAQLHNIPLKVVSNKINRSAYEVLQEKRQL